MTRLPGFLLLPGSFYMWLWASPPASRAGRSRPARSTGAGGRPSRAPRSCTTTRLRSRGPASGTPAATGSRAPTRTGWRCGSTYDGSSPDGTCCRTEPRRVGARRQPLARSDFTTTPSSPAHALAKLTRSVASQCDGSLCAPWARK